MRNRDFVELLRREIKSALKLIPWFVVSLLLLTVFWRSDLAAIAGLYQSPSGVFQSPPQETAVPPTAAPTETPTLEPTVPGITATVTTEASPTAAPSATLTPTVPVMPTATLTPTVQPTASPTVAPTQTPVVEPTSDSRYAEGDSNLTFDWGMLVDSLALGLSYVWLCCGVLILVGIPVVFIVLWVASKRAKERQEGAPEPESQGAPEPKSQAALEPETEPESEPEPEQEQGQEEE